MKIEFSKDLGLHPNEQTGLEKVLKNACSNNGHGYKVSISYQSETEVILIKIEPEHASHYINFHTYDLNKIGEILKAKLKFYALLDGELELTYFK